MVDPLVMRRRNVERSQQSSERTGEWRHTERAASQLSGRALPARPGAGRCSTSSPTRCRSSSSRCWPGSAGAGRGSGMWSTPLWRWAATVPVDEAKELVAELHLVLRDVRDVALDQDSIVEVARSVTAELRGRRPPGVAQCDVQDAARLIEWLVDGRFSFLGYHRYDGAEPPRPGSPLLVGSGLGVLRREEVARWVFDGVTPGLNRGDDMVVITRASAPSRVFRPVHPSVLAVQILDRAGHAVREHRFLGALTTGALHESVLEIPTIGRRVRASLKRAGAHPESHTGQRMLEVIA